MPPATRSRASSTWGSRPPPQRADRDQGGTDQLVWELDQLQYSIDQGPCVEVMKSNPFMYLEDAHHDHRWTDYLTHGRFTQHQP